MKRSLVAVVLAVFLAAAAGAAVLLYVKAADSRAVAGKEPVKVLVAAKRIPAGTTGAQIKKGSYVEVVAMPRSSVPADALSTLDSTVDNLALNADLAPRQLLLRGALAQPTKVTGGLAIPEGKLAVSVQMKVSENVAGYVRPGSKIAIFDTFTSVDGKSHVPSGERLKLDDPTDNHVTRVLLPGAEVIAIGASGQGTTATTGDGAQANTDKGAKANQPEATTVLVTVAVNQDEAERLVHAVQTGTLYLALLADGTNGAGDGVDNKHLFP